MGQTGGGEGASERLKAEGNELFQQRHYGKAVELYSAAIDHQETAVLFANRAAAHISLENYGSALADAEKAVALDPGYTKARRRRYRRLRTA